MSDFLHIVDEGNLLVSFANIIEVIVALDLVTLVCMIFGRAKNDI